jgi:hypothetical protein
MGVWSPPQRRFRIVSDLVGGLFPFRMRVIEESDVLGLPPAAAPPKIPEPPPVEAPPDPRAPPPVIKIPAPR